MSRNCLVELYWGQIVIFRLQNILSNMKFTLDTHISVLFSNIIRNFPLHPRLNESLDKPRICPKNRYAIRNHITSFFSQILLPTVENKVLCLSINFIFMNINCIYHLYFSLCQAFYQFLPPTLGEFLFPACWSALG